MWFQPNPGVRASVGAAAAACPPHYLVLDSKMRSFPSMLKRGKTLSWNLVTTVQKLRRKCRMLPIMHKRREGSCLRNKLRKLSNPFTSLVVDKPGVTKQKHKSINI